MSHHTPQALETTANAALAAFATGLTKYAERTPTFALELYAALTHISSGIESNRPCLTAPRQAHLMPRDLASARARLAWLRRELTERPTEETQLARDTLIAWSDERVYPEALILGVIGVEIPGPTLGIIKKSKSRQSIMPLVVTPEGAASDPADLTAGTHRASTRLLATELQEVRGDATRLEPDLADWCFFDQATALYTLPAHAFATACEQLSAEHIPHASIETGTGRPVLAITPATQTDILTELGATAI